MNNPKNFALRQALFAVLVKFAVLFGLWWLLFRGSNTPDQNWIEIGVVVFLWCIASGWDVYKSWKEHYQRKNQWRMSEESEA